MCVALVEPVFLVTSETCMTAGGNYRDSPPACRPHEPGCEECDWATEGRRCDPQCGPVLGLIRNPTQRSRESECEPSG